MNYLSYIFLKYGNKNFFWLMITSIYWDRTLFSIYKIFLAAIEIFIYRQHSDKSKEFANFKLKNNKYNYLNLYVLNY